MSRTERLIQKISQLPDPEVRVVYQALTQRLAQKSRVARILAQVSGSGTGVWGVDAQEYIASLRASDRT